jgi:hypothetical protein
MPGLEAQDAVITQAAFDMIALTEKDLVDAGPHPVQGGRRGIHPLRQPSRCQTFLRTGTVLPPVQRFYKTYANRARSSAPPGTGSVVANTMTSRLLLSPKMSRRTVSP